MTLEIGNWKLAMIGRANFDFQVSRAEELT